MGNGYIPSIRERKFMCQDLMRKRKSQNKSKRKPKFKENMHWKDG